MSYGQLNKTQLGVLAPLVIGKIIHDLGAGDLGLALELLRLGAAKIIAIDKEYNRKIFNGVPPEIELRHQFFQDMHDEIDIAFVSWPSNYENGLLEVLMQTKTIIYLGKNTDGSMCGTPALFEYLSTRKVEEHVPSRANTLICYTDTLRVQGLGCYRKRKRPSIPMSIPVLSSTGTQRASTYQDAVRRAGIILRRGCYAFARSMPSWSLLVLRRPHRCVELGTINLWILSLTLARSSVIPYRST